MPWNHNLGNFYSFKKKSENSNWFHGILLTAKELKTYPQADNKKISPLTQVTLLVQLDFENM